MRKILLLILVFCLTLSATALAHPGATDGNGGHRVSGTGEYHYHHGYPAHDHAGGTCPYDFDDKTGENSGSSSSGTSSGGSTNGSSSGNPSTSDVGSHSSSSPKKKTSSLGETLVFVFLEGPILLFAIWYLCWMTWGLLKIFIIEPITEAKREKENARIRENERRAEYQKISALYSNKTKTEIARLCGMPDTFCLDEDDFPHEKNNLLGIDNCIVYIANHGSVYHSHARCCQRYLSPVNIVQVRHLNTCRYCAPARIDLQWYDNYKEALRLMRKHGIEPLPEAEPNSFTHT